MNKSHQTIWQILDSRQAGGIESHILELSCGLKDAGWNVKIIFLKDYGPHPLKNDLSLKGVDFCCLDGRPQSLWNALTQEKPLLVHTHGYKAGILARLCGYFLNIPIISTFHAGEKAKGKLALYTYLDRLSAPLSTPIAVSQKIAMKLPPKTQCIDNFVNIPDYSKSIYNGKVAFVGRLSEEKGPDIFCQIAKENPNLSFHLYGEGPMREPLEKEYKNFVTFHGQVNMNDHWPEIDLLCMPSRFEGLPMAALEAMARSIPVLASDAGALPKLIDHTQTGWVIPLNRLSDFSQTLRHWQSMDNRLHIIMGKAARDKVKSLYSPQVIIPQIERIYYQVAGE